MTHDVLARKKCYAIGFILLLCGVFAVLYLVLNGNKPETFTDVVIEWTARDASNKSAERNLVYILSFLGILLYSIFYCCVNKKNVNELTVAESEPADENKIVLCFISVCGLVNYLVYANVNPVLFIAILISGFLFYIDRKLVALGFVFTFTMSYAVYGCYRAMVFWGYEKGLKNEAVAVLVIVLFIISMLFKNRQRILYVESLLAQLLCPCVLFIYLLSNYKFSGEIVTIQPPSKIRAVIILLIVCCLVEAAINLYRNWHKTTSLTESVTLGTCFCIMALNCFSGSGAIMPTDMHHPFENIIGFSQVFELGQKLFTEYIPVSGMYSMVQGAVFKLFGDGLVCNYYATNNMFYLGITLLIVLLLWKQTDRFYILLIALMFSVINYNRIAFLLPIMLLLSMPQLVARRFLWLAAWFLTSLFQGLYYPLFGAAVCLAFMPLGVIQIIALFKSGNLKKLSCSPVAWCGVLICAASFLFSIPCLWGSFLHIKAMADQTIFADGISRFGQTLPGWFFSYMNVTSLRLVFYYILTFLPLAALVLIGYVLALENWSLSKKNNSEKIDRLISSSIIFSLVIAPLVCYSYTVVRLDINSIYARSTGVLFAGAVLILLYCQRYLKNARLCYFAASFAIMLSVVGNSTAFVRAREKLYPHYTVPKDFIYVNNDTKMRLGSGFISEKLYDSIKNSRAAFDKQDAQRSYMVYPGNSFGYFYVNNVKGAGTMELGTLKGYGAAEEFVENVRRNHPVIGARSDTDVLYYLYHWLMTSGEYYWSPKERIFLFNDMGYDKEQVRSFNKRADIAAEDRNLGRTASSFGLSMNSLRSVFSEANCSFSSSVAKNSLEVKFDALTDGDAADYMYIEFADMSESFQYILWNHRKVEEQSASGLGKYLMKKDYNRDLQVRVVWKDDSGAEHKMRCAMNQGKILFPLGAGRQWLLNQHDFIRVSVLQNGKEIALPKVEHIEFLKLREVK